MKKWKKLLLGLTSVLLLLIAVGFVLPNSARVEQSILIQAEAGKVYRRIASLRLWPEWTAWTTNRFPDMQVRFAGTESGVGQVMIAEGKSSGNGTVRIIKADPALGIEYELNFERGTQIFHGSILYEKTTNGLNVVWTLHAPLGANPVKRWIGLAFDRLMSGDMATGLRNLKQQTEASPDGK